MTKTISETKKLIESRIIRDKNDKKTISYTEYSKFMECPHHWSLHYAHKLYPFTSNINSIFGSAMHDTLQNYLNILYSTTAKAADEFKSELFLEERMKFHYQQEKEKNKGQDFSNIEEFSEYYEDGVEIIRYFKKKRKLYFDSKNFELIGCEIPILYKLDHPILYFYGFLDVVLYDKTSGKIIIIDFKTSKSGWRDYQKKNEIKISQLVLYKKYFSEQYGIDIDKIEIQYIILKRKIPEVSDWPIPRISKFTPSSGKPTVNKALKNVEHFISSCFTDQGEDILEPMIKKPGDACKFCPFNNNENLCNQRN